MKNYQNILVGVDVAQLEEPNSAKFSPPVEEAIRKGIWAAGKMSASLTFIAVLDASEHALDSLTRQNQQRLSRHLEGLMTVVLEQLVSRAHSAQN